MHRDSLQGGDRLSKGNEEFFTSDGWLKRKVETFSFKAFAGIRRHLADAELVMVGDGPLLNEFKELARKLDLPVTFPGTLASAQVKEQMDEARVLSVFPALRQTTEMPRASGSSCSKPRRAACRGHIGTRWRDRRHQARRNGFLIS
jgi:hypothetical protein